MIIQYCLKHKKKKKKNRFLSRSIYKYLSFFYVLEHTVDIGVEYIMLEREG